MIGNRDGVESDRVKGGERIEEVATDVCACSRGIGSTESDELESQDLDRRDGTLPGSYSDIVKIEPRKR